MDKIILSPSKYVQGYNTIERLEVYTSSLGKNSLIIADDFITKPYNPTVLLLRIQNIFKRMEVKTDNVKYNNLNGNIVLAYCSKFHHRHLE